MLGEVNVGNLRAKCLGVIVVYFFTLIPSFQVVHVIFPFLLNETFVLHWFDYAPRLNPLLYSFSIIYNIIEMLR